jgi:hypothetical protein
MQQVVSTGKIASNRTMTTQLDKKLTKLLARGREHEIAAGLEPLGIRLARLFGEGNATEIQQKLAPFCREYIAQVPVVAQSLRGIGLEFRLSELLDPYLSLSTQYLEYACDEIDTTAAEIGLEQFLILLQGAYIFSRMLEELDDKIEVFVGIPLHHINMMDANLIVHEVIGDSFANRLDKVVGSLVKQSKVSKNVIEASLDRDKVETGIKDHLSLTGQPIENFAAQHGLDMLAGLA